MEAIFKNDERVDQGPGWGSLTRTKNTVQWEKSRDTVLFKADYLVY